MNFYEQIIELSKKEFGNRVIEAEVSQRNLETVLTITIDASREEEVTSMYPSIENGKLNVYESWSNALNLYIYGGNNAHYYYKGSVDTTKDGLKYVEHVDNDGLEYDADSVLHFKVNTPEEAVEWLSWIYGFRNKDLPETEIRIECETAPVSQWFEAPYVFLPSASQQLVPLHDLLPKVPVFSLPALHDKAYHLGNDLHPEYAQDPDKHYEEIRAMNREGQKEMEELFENFRQLATADNPLQPGDFLLAIGGNGLTYTMHRYKEREDQISDLYYVVLRPVPGASYAALYDFLFHQNEGLEFLKALLNPDEGMLATLHYLTDPKSQRLMVIQKKSDLAAAQNLLARLQNTRLSFEDNLARSSEAHSVLSELADKC